MIYQQIHIVADSVIYVDKENNNRVLAPAKYLHELKPKLITICNKLITCDDIFYVPGVDFISGMFELCCNFFDKLVRQKATFFYENV